MQLSKQVSVFLENKPGRLANVLLALARRKVNLIAMTVMDSHEHNVLRFVADNTDTAREVLKELSIPMAESDVLIVELRNQVGELAHLCELLGAEHVNIDYAYCSAGGRNGKSFGIFRMSNIPKAMKILSTGPTQATRKKLEQRPTRSRTAYARR